MNHHMMKFISITLLLWIGFPLSATAAEANEGADANANAAAGASESAKAEIGTRTSQWLDVQREGRIPGNLLPIPGAEAGLSYRRYINSFTRPIPDQLLLTAPVSSLQK